MATTNSSIKETILKAKLNNAITSTNKRKNKVKPAKDSMDTSSSQESKN